MRHLRGATQLLNAAGGNFQSVALVVCVVVVVAGAFGSGVQHPRMPAAAILNLKHENIVETLYRTL